MFRDNAEDGTEPMECRIDAIYKSSLFRLHRSYTYFEEDTEEDSDESERLMEKDWRMAKLARKNDDVSPRGHKP